jgi:hypothetical protein
MPAGVSILTLARFRRRHLRRLIEGLCRSKTQPGELIIVDMGGPPIDPPAAAFPIRILSLDADRLPLAQARNLAAASARHERLIFLNEHALHGEWDDASLRRNSKTHPVRAFPAAGIRVEPNPGLFWSLAFAVRRQRFNNLGGFDSRFTGYGAEDTDFGFRGHQAGVALLFLGGPGAFHQHHENFDPPLQHFEDIIRNAEIFRDIWGVWPMQGWLHAFARLGLIRLGDRSIITVRPPNRGELEMARSR